jgi:hypothetical protein
MEVVDGVSKPVVGSVWEPVSASKKEPKDGCDTEISNALIWTPVSRIDLISIRTKTEPSVIDWCHKYTQAS